MINEQLNFTMVKGHPSLVISDSDVRNVRGTSHLRTLSQLVEEMARNETLREGSRIAPLASVTNGFLLPNTIRNLEIMARGMAAMNVVFPKLRSKTVTAVLRRADGTFNPSFHHIGLAFDLSVPSVKTAAEIADMFKTSNTASGVHVRYINLLRSIIDVIFLEPPGLYGNRHPVIHVQFRAPDMIPSNSGGAVISALGSWKAIFKPRPL